MSVADFLRTIEETSPGTVDECGRIRAAFSQIESAAASAQPSSQTESGNPDWLQTGLNAVKRVKNWLNDTNSPSA
jgi:hypothetical protein